MKKPVVSLPKAAGIPQEAAELALLDEPVELPIDFPSRPSMLSLPVPIAEFGRFNVVGRLATGGMADIFLAQEKTLGGASRHVAIKLLRSSLSEDDEFEQMFLREGRVAMQLVHPNICHIYEFGKWGGHLFIAMEWVDGVHLRQLVSTLAERGERVPVPIVVRLIAQVAAALDSAHNARDSRRRPLGVVHRDVTPHNIMISFDGIVKLLDFGVAAVTETEEVDNSQSTTIKGKFGYFSPEQCKGERLDGRSDVFTLGICLFEALTQRRLYKRESQYASIQAIVNEEPISPREIDPDIPQELADIVLKALAKDPNERYETAGAFEQALLSHLSLQGQHVRSAEVRILMEAAFKREIARGPTLDRSDEALARLAPTTSHPPKTSLPPGPLGVEQIPAPVTASAPKSRAPLFIVVLMAVLGIAGVGIWLALGPPGTDNPESPVESEQPLAVETIETPEPEPEAEEEVEEAEPVAVTSAQEAAEAEAEARREEEAEAERRREERRRERARMRGAFFEDPGF